MWKKKKKSNPTTNQTDPPSKRKSNPSPISTSPSTTDFLYQTHQIHCQSTHQTHRRSTHPPPSREPNCHALNLIPGFVTMTGMLIPSLNLILTRTNLTFKKLLQKLPSFFSSLFLYLNDKIFHLTFKASTLYSKNNIIHQLLKF